MALVRPILLPLILRFLSSAGAYVERPPPIFESINQPSPHHRAFLRPLPQSLTLQATPLSFFQLFFTDEIIDTIIQNTNAYAASHQAGTKGREWEPLEKYEFIRYLAFLVYRGLYPSSRIADYWNKDEELPIHAGVQLSLLRVEQIKRFLHICHPDTQIKSYYDKVEPLVSHVQVISKRYYVPQSNLALDEMMVRFVGRSKHTFRIKNKPTPTGYKILALCDAGYTYAFLPESRVEKNVELQDQERIISSQGKELCTTAHKVMYLVDQLPQNSGTFNVYMDNYFSSVSLFKHMRDKSIGACGTTRHSSSMFPQELKDTKQTAAMIWNQKHAVVAEDVLCFLWIDSGPVTMLTTIHTLHTPESFVETVRRKPRLTSTNGHQLQRVFGDNARKAVSIPKAINDYNKNMGSVDIADQLRQYYSTQMRSLRTWMPLFLWLLDTSILNAYIMRCIHLKEQTKSSHRLFRISLYKELKGLALQIMNEEADQENGQEEEAPRKRGKYMTKNVGSLGTQRFD